MKKTLIIVAVLAMVFAGCREDGSTTGSLNGHGWVDLGLPSKTLWATTNIGAETPDAYGSYFAWGETVSQADNAYNWESYKYCNGDHDKITKYCNDPEYGDNGYTDALVVLSPEDDAATVNWGAGWHTPTEAEIQELYNNTTVSWTTRNDVNGRVFTASNGNSIFLPAAGFRHSGELSNVGNRGFYWSSSLCSNNLSKPSNAWLLDFNSEKNDMLNESRRYGFTVRPVCSAQK